MKAGNFTYNKLDDIPEIVPVFPLSGLLLLPGSQIPLNIFEPRYLAMCDAALSTNRLIGIVQPVFNGDTGPKNKPNLCQTGCLGRIVSFTESGDGRYIIRLQGVVRYRILEEMAVTTPFRQCRIMPFAGDLNDQNDADKVDREELLETFKLYLEANELEADWDNIHKADNKSLVNALSVMSPYGAPEKQALLEAVDLKSRADTLIALTQITLAREADGEEYTRTLQ